MNTICNPGSHVPHHCRRSRCHSQFGFTLIEVLVAVVVLSFGVLGVVGLQAAAIKSNQEVRYQMNAVQLARSLADMVRGNRAVGIKTDASDNPYLSDTTDSGAGSTPGSSVNCLATGSNCGSPADVANAQLTEWLSQVNSSLPSARVVVCFDGDPYTDSGLPKWACPSNPSANDNMVIKIGWTRTALDKSKVGIEAFDFARSENSNPGVLLSFAP